MRAFWTPTDAYGSASTKTRVLLPSCSVSPIRARVRRSGGELAAGSRSTGGTVARRESEIPVAQSLEVRPGTRPRPTIWTREAAPARGFVKIEPESGERRMPETWNLWRRPAGPAAPRRGARSGVADALGVDEAMREVGLSVRGPPGFGCAE